MVEASKAVVCCMPQLAAIRHSRAGLCSWSTQAAAHTLQRASRLAPVEQAGGGGVKRRPWGRLRRASVRHACTACRTLLATQDPQEGRTSTQHLPQLNTGLKRCRRLGPVEQAGGGGVEGVHGGDAPRVCAAGMHRLPHLAGQHLAQLHAPLVKAVDAPDEALHTGPAL